MPALSHSIDVNANLEWAFETCRDVSKWVLFMPAVRGARFINSSNDSDTVEIMAEANDQIWTWQSKRTLDRSRWRISFERISPPPPLISLSGSWQFTTNNREGVTVLLSHEFHTAPHNLEFEDFMKFSIQKNATRDLFALAELANNR